MPAPELRRVLTLRDLVLFHIVAIVGVRWYLTAARIGPFSIALWGLAVVMFFLPQGIAVVALSRRAPEEGGVYVWTRDAFGPLHGFLCGWSYWVNNLTYYPTLVLFAVGNAGFLFGLGDVTGAGGSSWALVWVSCGILWVAIGLNVLGAEAGRSLHNVGALSTWLVTALLVVLAALAWDGAAPAPSAGSSALSGVGSLALVSTLCFALAGLELAPSMGGEVKDAGRTLPRSIYWAAPAIALTYILGTLAILVASPPADVNIVVGIAHAVNALGARVGLSLAPLAAFLVVLTALGGLGAWLAGSARVPFAIGLDRYLPEFFGRLHPRWGTPYGALLAQGALATLFILASAPGATFEEAYLVLVDATIIVYFIPYLYLFSALVAHERRHPSQARWKTWYAAVAGGATTASAVLLALLPPEGVSSPGGHVAKVVAQASGLLAVGVALYAAYRRRTGRPPAAPAS